MLRKKNKWIFTINNMSTTTVDGIKFINNQKGEFQEYTITKLASQNKFCGITGSQTNTDWRIKLVQGSSNNSTITCLTFKNLVVPLYCPEINGYAPSKKNNVFWTTNADFDANLSKSSWQTGNL
jgi:hypothetical protein